MPSDMETWKWSQTQMDPNQMVYCSYPRTSHIRTTDFRKVKGYYLKFYSFGLHMRHLHYWIGIIKMLFMVWLGMLVPFHTQWATPKGRMISKDQLVKEYPDCLRELGDS